MDSIIYQDAFFTIEHSMVHCIAGYLILFFNQPLPLEAQDPRALAHLGPLIASAKRCIHAVTGASKVYCLLFCEKVETAHFHLFPRTQALKQEYESLHGSDANGFVSGPDLFSWMMKHKQGTCEQMATLIGSLREKINDEILTRNQLINRLP